MVSLPKLPPGFSDNEEEKKATFVRRPTCWQKFMFYCCSCIKVSAKRKTSNAAPNLNKQDLMNMEKFLQSIEDGNNQRAERLGFYKNEIVFDLPMNKGVPSGRDPRNMIQIVEQSR